MSRTIQVVRWAVCSRLLVLLLGTAARLLIPSYDTSSSIREPSLAADQFLARALSAFANWDSVFYLGIAERGYEFEQEHAFFPLLPAAIRGCAELGE